MLVFIIIAKSRLDRRADFAPAQACRAPETLWFVTAVATGRRGGLLSHEFVTDEV